MRRTELRRWSSYVHANERLSVTNENQIIALFDRRDRSRPAPPADARTVNLAPPFRQPTIRTIASIPGN